MRKILMVLVLFVSLKGMGQDKIPFVFTLPGNEHLVDYFGVPANYTNIFGRYRWIAGMFDSSFHIPRYNGVPVGLRVGSSNNDGLLASDTLNGHVYHYWNLSWNRLAYYTDITTYTANLPIRITGSVISADTSTAFTPSLTTNGRLLKVADSIRSLGTSSADGYSVLGRTGSTSGTAVSITAVNNEDVLFKNADVLQFGQPNVLKNQGNTIGDIFVKSTVPDTVGLIAYTNGSTIYSFNANRLRVQTTGNADNLDGRVLVDSFRTGLDKITAEIKVQYNTIGGTRYGIPFGMYNFNSARYSCLGFLWTAAGNPVGTVQLYTFQGAAPTLLSTASSLLSLSATDIIVHKFEAFENTVTYSVRNETTNSAWVSTSYTFKNTETKYSAGNIGIGSNAEGDWYLNSIKISSKEIKNPDVYLLGDSKFSKSTYQNESFISRLKNNYGVVVANSDVGGASSDAVEQLELIIDYIKPKKVLYSNSNDERYSIANATWQAQYDTIYNRLTRYGVEVLFTSFPETGASQADVNTFLAANYPSVYIQRPYTVLSGINTSDYLLGDGIHLTANGNKIAYDETVLDGKLNGNRADWFKDVGIIPPSIETGYGTLYNRADSLRFKNDAGTEFTLGRGGSGENIYNTSAMLTGNRTLTGNAHIYGLTFDSLNTFEVRRNNVTRINMTSAITSLISPNNNNAININNNVGNIVIGTGGSGNLAVGADSVTSEDRIVNLGNLHGLYTAYTLVDKSYVDSVADVVKPALNKALTIEAPSAAEAIDMWQTPVAITVTSLKAILRGTSPSVTYNIRFGTDITSSTDVFTSNITCTSVTTGCSNSSGFNDATIPAGSFIWVITSASSGTINSISLTLNYTED